MSIVDDIQAIRADAGLTPAQKRAAIYDLKGQRIVEAIATHVGQPIVRGNFILTLTKPPTYRYPRLTFPAMTLTRLGVPVPLNLPLHMVNPPVLVPDGLGGFTLNLLQAVRDAIIDMVRDQ